MRAFGFSAFLKLLCLNDRPQRREVRSRLAPSGEAYDYHRSLRLRIQRYLVAGQTMAEVVASIDAIRRASERQSVRTGLERLEAWRAANPGEPLAYQAANYEGPAGILQVKFTPDFGLRMGREGVAVHVWNTATPQLQPRMVSAALSLVAGGYADSPGHPDDLAVLSLPDMALFRLSEAGRLAGIGPSVAERIEETFRQERERLGLPPFERRPGGPPP